MHAHKTMLLILFPLMLVMGIAVFFYVWTSTAAPVEKNDEVSTGASPQHAATVPTTDGDVTPQTAPAHPLAAYDMTRIADIQKIDAALGAYYADNGSYPNTEGYPYVLGVGVMSCLGTNGFVIADECASPYLSPVPADPEGEEYGYVSEDGTTYHIIFSFFGSHDGYAPGTYGSSPETGIVLDEPLVYTPTIDDSDGDGLLDEYELAITSDPHNPDSDADGFGDFIELIHGYNPAGDGELAGMGPAIREFMSQMYTGESVYSEGVQ